MPAPPRLLDPDLQCYRPRDVPPEQIVDQCPVRWQLTTADHTWQAACCKRIVRCSATEEHGFADLDGKDRPHPTKTALSKLKKVGQPTVHRLRACIGVLWD